MSKNTDVLCNHKMKIKLSLIKGKDNFRRRILWKRKNIQLQ